MDRGDLWHWGNRRDGLTPWERWDGWHGWDRWDGRYHELRAGRGPPLIGAAYGHRDAEEWHEPAQDDHHHGSGSHCVCPPWLRAASVCTRVSLEYTDASGARQHHRDGGLEGHLPPRKPRHACVGLGHAR